MSNILRSFTNSLMLDENKLPSKKLIIIIIESPLYRMKLTSSPLFIFDVMSKSLAKQIAKLNAFIS